MSTGSSPSKPRFWSLPADNFVESLRDPAQRQQLSQKLRGELRGAFGLLFFALAVQIFLVFLNRSEMNEFWFWFIYILCSLRISDIRHRRHLIELFEILTKKENGA